MYYQQKNLFVRGGSLVVVMLVILICYLNEVLMVVIHGQTIRLLCMVMGILRETQLR